MNWSDDGPLVSCVMVTADRMGLARRSVDCFLAQTHGNRELVIVDDGSEDYAPLLEAIPSDRLVYRKVEKRPETTLGALRNLTLELARGQVVAQWDDDDWYHPHRLSRQVAELCDSVDVCLLRGTLMHLDAPIWFDHPYVGTLKPGVPGSIVHRANPTARYPETRRGEDTVFLDNWPADRIRVIEAPELFIRAFHGSNTWEAEHFQRRVRNNWSSALEYFWRRHVNRDIFRHSRFRLGPAEQQAFAMFLADSRAAGLFA
ncbi:glycosyltransferase family A protein [Stakelama marina]|uniref:Glycosyltransferase family 2 protein n=1 Tax=Stakelama marina TaxID=2826939 RepID=A0A8T4IBB5_9SPHN|nr:glycosyltransferase family A protein [Stakelama marina]MBR0552308.1 glycosyltransferase family 2 protein [Stakelama marina]